MKDTSKLTYLALLLLLPSILGLCNSVRQSSMQKELRSMQKEVSEMQWELTDNIHETVRMQEDLADKYSKIDEEYTAYEAIVQKVDNLYSELYTHQCSCEQTFLSPNITDKYHQELISPKLK